ncbi:FAD-dependent oxidoreductase [Stieleria varia]
MTHASYRVAGNAVATGEAAGVAAARSIAMGVLPHELQWNEVSRGNR